MYTKNIVHAWHRKIAWMNGSFSIAVGNNNRKVSFVFRWTQLQNFFLSKKNIGSITYIPSPPLPPLTLYKLENFEERGICGHGVLTVIYWAPVLGILELPLPPRPCCLDNALTHGFCSVAHFISTFPRATMCAVKILSPVSVTQWLRSQFDSESGHMLALWSWCPVGGMLQ